MPSYALEQLQAVVTTYLAADPMFDGQLSANSQPVPIITELKGDIINEITMALDKVGICVVVLTPVFELIMPDQPCIDGWASFQISVFEHVVINQAPNGTQIRSVSAAQRILALTHFYQHGLPAAQGFPAVIKGTKQPITLANEGPPLQYLVSLQARLDLSEPQP